MRITAQRSVAIHEAAHAIIAQVCGLHVTGLSMQADHRTAGRAYFERREDDPHAGLLATLAGEVAERYAGDDRPKSMWASDNARAIEDAQQEAGDTDRYLEILRDARDEATELVAEHWLAISTLADSLEANGGQLEGEAAMRAIAMARQGRLWRGFTGAAVPARSAIARPTRRVAVPATLAVSRILADMRARNDWRERLGMTRSVAR